VVGVASGVIGRRLVLLFRHAILVVSSLCDVGDETLAFFLLHLQLHHSPLETGTNYTSTNNSQGKGKKTDFDVQRVLESGKRELKAG
jgi:hypothetical protein